MKAIVFVSLLLGLLISPRLSASTTLVVKDVYLTAFTPVETKPENNAPPRIPSAQVQFPLGGESGDVSLEEVVNHAAVAFDGQVAAMAQQLNKQGSLPSATVFQEMLKKNTPAPVALLPVATAPLRGREVARRAASAYLRIGWVYRCSQCSRWHTQLAGGYAIAADTVVTARHVFNPPSKMKSATGFPVIIRGDSELLPLVGVLAADVRMDTVVLRVGAVDLVALPLLGAIEVGDPVFCLSDPAGHRGIFTAGIVNRMSVRAGGSSENPADRRLTVGTDWAPGSSGAAILDSCGNAVGHVATIQAVFGKKPANLAAGGPEVSAPVAMNLHDAIPAGSVQGLLVPVSGTQ